MINLYWLILFPIIIGILCLLSSPGLKTFLSITGQIILTAYVFYVFFSLRQDGEIFQIIGNWPLYMGIGLKADLLSGAFIALTGFLFSIYILFSYNSSYSDNLFVFLFLTLEGLILGIFLANDLFTLFVLIEVSTLIVSILIMYKKDKRSIYDGMMYLLINIVAMSFFLFGVGMLYKQTGLLDLEGIHLAIQNFTTARNLILPYAFMLTAVSLKSAIMPLFSWLPKAHGTPSAPSIVSAVLSGLYVKSGIYLFIRLQAVFSPIIQTQSLFLVLGLITALVGVLCALRQNDLKLILAYSTVSQIGLILVGLNLNSQAAFWGSILHIINHAIFKSGLFLVAGMIIEEYQTRDIRKIRGLFRRMPFVSVSGLLLILGISGAPFFNGSISKYFIASGSHFFWLETLLIIINLGTIMIFLDLLQIFKNEQTLNSTQKTTLTHKKALVLFIGLCCLIGGVTGAPFINFIFGQHLSIVFSSYLLKSLIYVISVLVGFLILFLIRKSRRFLPSIQGFELSFNGICFSIFFYFIALTLYLNWIYQ